MQMTDSPRTQVWREPHAFALLLAATLTVMANATISPALPQLERMFAGQENSEFLVRLLVPAPSLLVILCAPISGWLADRVGRKRILMAGIGLFVLAGSAGYFLSDLTAILASRFVLGIAVAIIMTVQTALVGDYFEGERRYAMTGLQTSARNFGAVVFVTLAGWAAAYSAKLPFLIYALAGLYLPFIWRYIYEPRVIQPTSKSSTSNNGVQISGWLLLLLGLSFFQMLTNMVFFIVPTQLPFFFEQVSDQGTVLLGLAIGSLALTGGFVALTYGRLQKLLGDFGTFALGYGAMAAGYWCLSSLAGQWTIFAGTVLIGAGFAAAMPGFVTFALRIAPQTHRGTASGILTTAVFSGQFLSPFLSVPLVSAFGYVGLFRAAAMLLTILSIMAIGARLLAPKASQAQNREQ